MPAASRGAMKALPCWLYEPTTAVTFLSAARRAQSAAPAEVLCSLQVSTRSSWPLIPPAALTHRAYALAMAGMPGMFVALVPSGAHVMTVTGSLEPPGRQGARHIR